MKKQALIKAYKEAYIEIEKENQELKQARKARDEVVEGMQKAAEEA